MRSRAPLRSLVAVSALAAAGCMGGESTVVTPPPPTPAEPAPGPAHLIATVRAGPVSYRLRGRWDPADGYRVCALIEDAPDRYGWFEGRMLWLEGRNHAYGTLTAPGLTCRPRRLWLDDHPPTLPLFGPFARPGAEDYLHAALLALGGMRGSGPVDFRQFDRDPPRRDEDGWTLRPLLRKLGTRRVGVRIGRSGYVERLRLVGPRRVTVTLRLSGFGTERRVPYVERYAIE